MLPVPHSGSCCHRRRLIEKKTSERPVCFCSRQLTCHLGPQALVEWMADATERCPSVASGKQQHHRLTDKNETGVKRKERKLMVGALAAGRPLSWRCHRPQPVQTQPLLNREEV